MPFQDDQLSGLSFDLVTLNEDHTQDLFDIEAIERAEERDALERARRRPHRVIHELPRRDSDNGYVYDV